MTLLEALKVLVDDEHIGDHIYYIRDNAIGDDPSYKGNSWDHPRVKRFSDAVHVIEQEVKANAG